MSLKHIEAGDWGVGRETGARFTAIGGPLLVVGAGVSIAHIVLRSLLTAGVDPIDSAQASAWVPVNAFGAIGAMLVLLGLPAIGTRVGGLRGLIGLALIAASWTFFGVFLSLYGALVLPWLADEAPRLVGGDAATPVAFVAAFALGLLTWLAGTAILAPPFLRGQSQPRWVGYALPGSALWFLVGSFIIAPDGPASNLAVNLLSNLGPVLLLIALGELGRRAWTEAGAR